MPRKRNAPSDAAEIFRPSPQILNADARIPAGIVGPVGFSGKFAALPPVAESGGRVPFLVFLHGSSGLNAHIRAFQDWLAEELRIASIVPDSFAAPGRPTYVSPAPVEVYERVHALREAEIGAALAALPTLKWADTARLFLAGTSEGGVAVARWRGNEFRARIIYSWPCENNYFVDRPRNGFGPQEAVLNLMSSADPYFGPRGEWNKAYRVRGHGAEAFGDNPNALAVLLPNAPHTLFNLPAARWLTASFIGWATGL
jgi:hypothetical protein